MSISVAQPRSTVLLVGLFGLLALLLAALGIYGVVARSVSRRLYEIGVRMALGASAAAVGRMIVLRGLGPALAGVLTGVLVAALSTRVLDSLLFGVPPTDPLTFVATALLLMGIAFLACLVPARRATRVDPNTALRHD